jgi:hypothetical protein
LALVALVLHLEVEVPLDQIQFFLLLHPQVAEKADQMLLALVEMVDLAVALVLLPVQVARVTHLL